MCKGETVQRSYLLKYAAKLRITEQACKWTFVGLMYVWACPEAIVWVFWPSSGELKPTMEKYVFFYRK